MVVVVLFAVVSCRLPGGAPYNPNARACSHLACCDRAGPDDLVFAEASP
jgi:hypothetical protein